jgi:hypothetical protein
MKKYIELLAKFHIALLTIGVILILLSVTTGLELPIIKNIIPDENSRELAFGGGFLIIVFAIIIYLFEKKHAKTEEQPIITTTGTGNGGDTKKQFNKSEITSSQRELLNFIEEQFIQYGVIGQETIEKRFEKIAPSELFYRLETLCYQKFLVKETAAIVNKKQRFSYKLSKEFCDAYDIKVQPEWLSSTNSGLTPPPYTPEKRIFKKE